MKLLKLLGILALFMVAQTGLRELERRQKYIALDRINSDLAGKPPNPNDLRRQKSTLLQDLKHHEEALSAYEEISAPTSDDFIVLARLRQVRDRRQQTLKETGDSPRHVAALIGVSTQLNPRLQRISTAQNEVKEMQNVLMAGPVVPLEIRFDVSGADGNRTRQASIRNAIERLINDHTRPIDTAYMYISAHGLSELSGGRRAFLMGSDSNPWDKRAAGYGFSDLHRLIEKENRGPGKILVFADLCRAAMFENRPNQVNTILRDLFSGSRRVQLVLAGCRSAAPGGQPRALDHFTEYLTRGLKGEADRNPKNNVVTSSEIYTYLRTELGRATGQREIPDRIGADFDIPLTKVASAAQGSPPSDTGLRAFAHAGPRLFASLLPPSPFFAFAQDTPATSGPTLTQQLFTTDDLAFTSAVELEDLGQRVILNYLEGPSVPQRKEEFDAAAGFFRLANELNPSRYLVGREAFCVGRSLIFEKRYSEAVKLLSERTIAIESDAAYAYNAMGIAYLEQRFYAQARGAFEEAIRLAPTWPYPALNLALTYTEQGQYREAERAYLAGMRVPRPAPYLLYNLGVLYHRLNRKGDARRMYNRASEMDKQFADPHIGIGALWAGGKRNDKNFQRAEAAYGLAMSLDAKSSAARHSLALLYLTRETSAYRLKAIRLLEQSIADRPDFLASQLLLAETVTPTEPARAALIYCDVLDRHPNLVVARINYAEALRRTGDADSAESELRRALAAAPANWRVLEAMGDLLRTGRPEEAAKVYKEARLHAPERAQKRRLEQKRRDVVK